MAQYNIIGWIMRFPHWKLSVRLLQRTPPPPGEAAQRVAANATGKNPDRAVKEARRKGDIPNLKDLPKPWGPNEYTESFVNDMPHAGYTPPSYPSGFSPLVDAKP